MAEPERKGLEVLKHVAGGCAALAVGGSLKLWLSTPTVLPGQSKPDNTIGWTIVIGAAVLCAVLFVVATVAEQKDR